MKSRNEGHLLSYGRETPTNGAVERRRAVTAAGRFPATTLRIHTIHKMDKYDFPLDCA
ncbi:hypothetical protein ACFXOS_11920 [Streptomyces sp. NPDC059175]|uniref:hypothetical protein n=1 Tax=Streptomyces sp. NPDC059175 TaxID=3346757 RepID=UPI003675E341